MSINKQLAGVVVGAALIGGLVATQTDTTTEQVLDWDKPTTDAEWAEDVKAENFDIKSTDKLEEMVESHTAKLEKNQTALKKYEDCRECVEYEYYTQFLTNGMSDKEAKSEAQTATQVDYDQRLFEVEKLKQSLERMNKEIELREKGFVQVADEKEPLFGAVNHSRIRYIND